MAYILDQVEKIGRSENLVKVKRVSKIPGEDSKGKPQMFALKFPCLRMVIKEDHDMPEEHYILSWSDYYRVKKEHPGKFILKRMEQRHVVPHERYQGKVAMKNGKPVIDMLQLAAWGTSYDRATGEYSYGEDHPKALVECWKRETESLEATMQMLVDRFGFDLAEEALGHFVTHKMYCASQGCLV